MPTTTSSVADLLRRRRAAAEVLLGGGVIALAIVSLRRGPERLPCAPGRSVPRRSVPRRHASPAGLEEQDRALTEARRAQDLASEAGERARVAREIQDLVTHGLTAMTVQTTAARRLLRSEPDTADQILAAVERVGREAAEEMRTLLAVLGPDGPPERHPQPDLSELDELVASARADGVQVELASAGAPCAVDPGVALTAYRVVEEALTVARGQADCCRVRVTLSWRGDLLDVAVEEDGPVVRDGARTAPRDRLLRERVRAYGGRLHTTARAGGGFAVHVTLPTRRSAA